MEKSSRAQRRRNFFAWLSTFASVALSGLFFVKIRTPLNLWLYVGKMLATALSPFVALFGIMQAMRGLNSGAWPPFVAGGASGVLAIIYMWRVLTQHVGFEKAFGPDWRSKIPSAQRARTRRARVLWYLPRRLALVPQPRWTRDLVYWTLTNPETGEERPLLCDLWQPPENVTPSGLALVYCHGGAWHRLDKDFGTRPVFRYLALQGHVVMDIAYRLWPETDLFGMIGDVKRAIVWLKANAARYGINPDRIVVSGGSAGGHLALLTAYTPHHPALTPEDLRDADTTVRAVVSFYGAVDMRATYYNVPGNPEIGWLLGGSPDEVPEMYALASPIIHAGPASPPTLLFQGQHDYYMPLEATRALHRKLLQAGVPSVYAEFPQTDHAFDLILPHYAPAARVARHTLDNFLSLML
ncbi:MAG TPA: alpha/beta hydrolase [Anaerolineae bacterium]|nr:alpha/beta hydrolase [Anaerolineae bacterium]HQK14866.1 alpha/beta hydrolase [Anaerolineae bacterium]